MISVQLVHNNHWIYNFLDGWTTDDLIYKWKIPDPVQLAGGLSLPGGFKLVNYTDLNCDVVTATGELLNSFILGNCGHKNCNLDTQLT